MQFYQLKYTKDADGQWINPAVMSELSTDWLTVTSINNSFEQTGVKIVVQNEFDKIFPDGAQAIKIEEPQQPEVAQPQVPQLPETEPEAESTPAAESSADESQAASEGATVTSESITETTGTQTPDAPAITDNPKDTATK